MMLDGGVGRILSSLGLLGGQACIPCFLNLKSPYFCNGQPLIHSFSPQWPGPHLFLLVVRLGVVSGAVQRTVTVHAAVAQQ